MLIDVGDPFFLTRGRPLRGSRRFAVGRLVGRETGTVATESGTARDTVGAARDTVDVALLAAKLLLATNSLLDVRSWRV